MSTLKDWTETVAVALELDTSGGVLDEKLVLDVARDAAHGVARPAAPLTTYLLGFAVARGADPREAAEKITRLAADWT